MNQLRLVAVPRSSLLAKPTVASDVSCVEVATVKSSAANWAAGLAPASVYWVLRKPMFVLAWEATLRTPMPVLSTLKFTGEPPTLPTQNVACVLLLEATDTLTVSGLSVITGGGTATAIGRVSSGRAAPAPSGTSFSAPNAQEPSGACLVVTTRIVSVLLSPGMIVNRDGKTEPARPCSRVVQLWLAALVLRKVRVNVHPSAQWPLAMLARLRLPGSPPVAGLAATKFALVSCRTRPALAARASWIRPEPLSKGVAGV